MNSGINLAVKRVDPEQQKSQNHTKRLRLFGYAFLAVFTLASIILFILLQASPLASLRQEEERLSLALNAQNEKMQNEVLINNQLSYIQEILTNRSDLPEVVGAVVSIMPPSATISSYQTTNGLIEMTIQSSSLTDLEKFFDELTTLSQGGDIYSEVVISNISMSTIGRYSFMITMKQ